MNQQQLQKLAAGGYISLQRDKKKIMSITIRRNGRMSTYQAEPARDISKKKHKEAGTARKGAGTARKKEG